MSSGALFGNNVTRGASKNLVEFKAGKMTMKGNKVYPDNRKGQLYVYQADDTLMHLCWKDRTSGVVEDDLIIFPGDCEFKHVPQCTTGRVYLLQFKLINRRLFFWLQDLKTDKDEEHCRKVNDVLNNPPTPGSQRSGGGIPEGDLQNLLNNMSQQQLIRLFGGVGQIGGLGNLLGTMNQPHSNARTTTTTSSTPVATTIVTRPPAAQTPAPSATASAPTATATASAPSATCAAPTATSAAPTATGDASDTTGGTKASSRTTAPASESEDDSRTLIKVGDLVHYLSEIPTVSGGRVDQSGQAGPVIRQFGLGAQAVNAATNGNLEEFVSALEFETKDGQQQQQQQQSQSEKGKDEKSKKQPPSGAGSTDKKDDDDEDEGMCFD